MIRRRFTDLVGVQSGPGKDEIRVYVLEMMLELAGMALTIGDGELADDLSQVLGRHGGDELALAVQAFGPERELS